MVSRPVVNKRTKAYLDGWLRAVRPDTTADHDWADSVEAADLLAAVQLRTASQAGQATGRTGGLVGAIRRHWQPVLATSVTAAAVVTVLALPGNSNRATNGTGVNRPPAPLTIRPAAMLLSSANSCGQLLSDLRAHGAAAASGWMFGQFAGDSMLTRGAQAPQALLNGAAAASAATSTTNVQEVGVDEPDIVKTEPGRVVSLIDGKLRVVDATTRKITGSLDLTGYVGGQSAQLLVDGDHALVMAGDDLNGSRGAVMPSSPALAPRVRQRSTYLFIELAGQPRITGSLHADGRYLDARQIGATVRLVVRSSPTLTLSPSSDAAAIKRQLKALPLSAWLPSYSIGTGETTSEHTVPCGQVSHPSAYTASSLLTVYTLDLNNLGGDTQPVTVVADGDTVYATSSSLYIASNPDWYCCMRMPAVAGPPIRQAQQTQLHRFDISGTGRPAYLGSASVPGRLLSQYSLSEYDGSLRVATTQTPNGQAESSSVLVLNAESLKVTGQLDGLGKNEQIYAVRFEGPMAYLVTFRQTDPLFLIDLHDPAAPTVVGSLQLTGYSDYLHDLGGGRLLGVGQEASAAGRVAGLQVSLFDLNTPTKPVRTGHVVLTDAPGENTLDPHQFLYWQPTGLIVVPVQSWTPKDYGTVLVLKVSGTTLSRIGLLANPKPAGRTDDGQGVQRSLIVDSDLWTVSGNGVQVSDPANLARLAWISFG